MANGCDVKVTKTDFERKSTDDKLICLWEIVEPMQRDVQAMKKWATMKIFTGAMAGGALMILALILLGVKVL
jgi:hypothetical protein